MMRLHLYAQRQKCAKDPNDLGLSYALLWSFMMEQTEGALKKQTV